MTAADAHDPVRDAGAEGHRSRSELLAPAIDIAAGCHRTYVPASGLDRFESQSGQHRDRSRATGCGACKAWSGNGSKLTVGVIAPTVSRSARVEGAGKFVAARDA